MRVLYLADAVLFLLFLWTLVAATTSTTNTGYEVIGLLAFLFWGLPALVLLSLDLPS